MSDFTDAAADLAELVGEMFPSREFTYSGPGVTPFTVTANVQNERHTNVEGDNKEVRLRSFTAKVAAGAILAGAGREARTNDTMTNTATGLIYLVKEPAEDAAFTSIYCELEQDIEVRAPGAKRT